MTRVALFAAGLAGAFLAAFGAGQAIDLRDRTVAEAAAHGQAMSAPAGLAVEQDGYRLVHERAAFTVERAQAYVFRIFGPDGKVVRDFDVEQERRLHLIVVGRSPGAPFLHLHPRQRADASWTVPLDLPIAGSYRVFADFTTDGVRRTLGIDLAASGGPEGRSERRSIYDVSLETKGDRLEFDVRDDGRPIETQPYLGAGGHLVVLREGDLAYIHAHAEEDELAFDVPFPSEGQYRLYLQFKVRGSVETVELEATR